MTRKKEQAPVHATDGYINMMTRLGDTHGAAGGTYVASTLSQNRGLLENMYQTSWIAAAIVNMPAEDMARAGLSFVGDSADTIDPVYEWLLADGWDVILEALRWARLYGGSAIVIDDGNDLDQPLKRVQEGQDVTFHAFDRWRIIPQFLDANRLTHPTSYQIPDWGEDVHQSRVIRFEGAAVPYIIRLRLQGWGDSVLQPVHDRIVQFDAATASMSELVQQSYIKTFQIDRMREVLAAGGVPEENMLRSFEIIRQTQNILGYTLLDGSDKFTANAYSFTGLDAVMEQFGMQLSGASGVPMVRLFGQSPRGMNATGESDLRNYYDGIHAKQESMLRRPITRLMRIVKQSLCPQAPGDVSRFEFTPLWQATPGDKLSMASALSANIQSLYANGLMTQEQALSELRRGADTTGVGSSITLDDISAAGQQTKPPPAPAPIPPKAPNPTGLLGALRRWNSPAT